MFKITSTFYNNGKEVYSEVVARCPAGELLAQLEVLGEAFLCGVITDKYYADMAGAVLQETQGDSMTINVASED